MVNVDETRLCLLRDCAVIRPDGSIDSLANLQAGTTLARIGSRYVAAARNVLAAWEADTAVQLPDLVIWPNHSSMVNGSLAHGLGGVSVADIDHQIAGILPSDEIISFWRVSSSTVIHTGQPRRRVDHVIDLGDVLR